MFYPLERGGELKGAVGITKIELERGGGLKEEDDLIELLPY